MGRGIHDFIVNELKAIPAPLNYNGFPKSICTSDNNVVCHGIPGEKKLKKGDIITTNKTSLKIGIQFLAYNCEKSFKDFISPWIKLKDKYDLYFFVGSVQFTLYKKLGYKDKNEGTIKMFKTEYNDIIDYLYSPEGTKTEEQVRNKCLKLFKEEEIDIMWAVDSDEFFTEKEVENIIKFIKENEKYKSK